MAPQWCLRTLEMPSSKRSHKILSLKVDRMYECLLSFARKNPRFISKKRFVSFAKGETFDPMSDAWQNIVLVSCTSPAPGRPLSWSEIKCKQFHKYPYIKFGDPTHPFSFCWNLAYKRKQRWIFWLETAANLGDLMRGLGTRTSRSQVRSLTKLMRRLGSAPLTNHNRDINLLHFKEVSDRERNTRRP